MADYPTPRGAFISAMKKWKKKKLKFQWTGIPESPMIRPSSGGSSSDNGGSDGESVALSPGEKSVKSKTKYSCDCGLNAWAKPNAHLVCGDCSITMTPAATGNDS